MTKYFKKCDTSVVYEYVEFIDYAGGNTELGQDGNWRLRINAAGEFATEKRISGVWVEKDASY